jgi:hypothetical protein
MVMVVLLNHAPLLQELSMTRTAVFVASTSAVGFAVAEPLKRDAEIVSAAVEFFSGTSAADFVGTVQAVLS